MSQQTPTFDPQAMRDVSMPITKVVTVGLWLALLLLILPAIPYLLIWGLPTSFSFGLNEILFSFIGLILLVIAHEAIHAIGWIVFAGAPREAIRFGVDLKTFSPYAHLKIPVKTNGYRIAVALPLILTGILPVIIGTVIGHGWLTFLGTFMVSGAVGDLIVLWVIRSVPGDARVLDHPSNVGCYVLLE